MASEATIIFSQAKGEKQLLNIIRNSTGHDSIKIVL